MSSIQIIAESSIIPMYLQAKGKKIDILDFVTATVNDRSNAKKERVAAMKNITQQAEDLGANAIILTHDNYYQEPARYGWIVSGNAVLITDIEQE
jgi:uncharacterized protein YbjQ (UPF0145 family)